MRILTITDEHTREALATPTARRLGADDTVRALEHVACLRGHAPRYIRCDNGPELVSQALHDWCRFNATTTAYIEPGAPWQNPYAESFNGHLRRELLDIESFNTLHEAQLLANWRTNWRARPANPLPSQIAAVLKTGSGRQGHSWVRIPPPPLM